MSSYKQLAEDYQTEPSDRGSNRLTSQQFDNIESALEGELKANSKAWGLCRTGHNMEREGVMGTTSQSNTSCQQCTNYQNEHAVIRKRAEIMGIDPERLGKSSLRQWCAGKLFRYVRSDGRKSKESTFAATKPEEELARLRSFTNDETSVLSPSEVLYFNQMKQRLSEKCGNSDI
ncbi:uncharacterized protein IL334_007249 [Kwoniella shivajii]|uniref:Uncharacterized protein n=1 Tax=Kwoniella shivajii TaxID=564305 RepID=A0ABZ1D853_9TREE|nr:hypothetical protein IL334_007249 [Kwoniella shivajii]